MCLRSKKILNITKNNNDDDAKNEFIPSQKLKNNNDKATFNHCNGAYLFEK